MNLPSGTRIGPYLIRDRLGEGGLADVWRALDTRTGADVALKVLDAVRRAENPGLLDRMLREAAILESLGHVPAVVRFVEMLEDPGTHTQVLALELIDGRSLATLLGTHLPVRTVLEWMGHACHALHDVHEAGWVHRDLKPDNLLLVDDPDLPLRLIDFNSAGSVAAGAGKLTRVQGVFPHTPAYLAPECFDGVPPDASADVYALGMTFAELLLGRHPLLPSAQQDLATNTAWQRAHEDVPFPHLPSVRPDVPEALHQVLARACAKDRDGRIPDAVALWDALKDVWDGLGSTPDAGPAPDLPDGAQRGPPAVESGPPQRTSVDDVPARVLQRPPEAIRRSPVPRVLFAVLAGLVFVGGIVGAASFWRARAMEEQRGRDLAVATKTWDDFQIVAQRVTADARARVAERDRLAAEAAAARAEQERVAMERERARQRAAGLGRGVEPVEAVISDPVTLEKLMNTHRIGSHFLYDSGPFGTLTVEQVAGVTFVEGRQESGSERFTLDGVVTAVDRTGMTVRGRMYVVEDGTAPCVREGEHRFNLAGHPWHFRGNMSCPNGWHYIDALVDDAWIAQNPSHGPG